MMLRIDLSLWSFFHKLEASELVLLPQCGQVFQLCYSFFESYCAVRYRVYIIVLQLLCSLLSLPLPCEFADGFKHQSNAATG